MTPDAQKKATNFKTLGDAFQFLDNELASLEKAQRLYHHHVRELMEQLAQQAVAKPKRKKK